MGWQEELPNPNHEHYFSLWTGMSLELHPKSWGNSQISHTDPGSWKSPCWVLASSLQRVLWTAALWLWTFSSSAGLLLFSKLLPSIPPSCHSGTLLWKSSPSSFTSSSILALGKSSSICPGQAAQLVRAPSQHTEVVGSVPGWETHEGQPMGARMSGTKLMFLSLSPSSFLSLCKKSINKEKNLVLLDEEKQNLLPS